MKFNQSKPTDSISEKLLAPKQEVFLPKISCPWSWSIKNVKNLFQGTQKYMNHSLQLVLLGLLKFKYTKDSFDPVCEFVYPRKHLCQHLARVLFHIIVKCSSNSHNQEIELLCRTSDYQNAVEALKQQLFCTLMKFENTHPAVWQTDLEDPQFTCSTLHVTHVPHEVTRESLLSIVNQTPMIAKDVESINLTSQGSAFINFKQKVTARSLARFLQDKLDSITPNGKTHCRCIAGADITKVLLRFVIDPRFQNDLEQVKNILLTNFTIFKDTQSTEFAEIAFIELFHNINQNLSGSSKKECVAFLGFVLPQQANAAVEQFSSKVEFLNKSGIFFTQNYTPTVVDTRDSSRVYVSNLPKNLNDKEVNSICLGIQKVGDKDLSIMVSESTRYGVLGREWNLPSLGWGIIDFFDNSTAVAAIVFLNGTALLDENAKIRMKLMNAPLSLEQLEIRAVHRVGFLIKSYKVQFWYFELIAMAHKLIMTCVVMFVAPGSQIQILFALTISFGFCVLTAYIQPFVKNKVCTTSVFSLLSHCTALLYGILLSTDGLTGIPLVLTTDAIKYVFGCLLIAQSTLICCLPFLSWIYTTVSLFVSKLICCFPLHFGSNSGVDYSNGRNARKWNTSVLTEGLSRLSCLQVEKDKFEPASTSLSPDLPYALEELSYPSWVTNLNHSELSNDLIIMTPECQPCLVQDIKAQILAHQSPPYTRMNTSILNQHAQTPAMEAGNLSWLLVPIIAYVILEGDVCMYHAPLPSDDEMREQGANFSLQYLCSAISMLLRRRIVHIYSSDVLQDGSNALWFSVQLQSKLIKALELRYPQLMLYLQEWIHTRLESVPTQPRRRIAVGISSQNTSSSSRDVAVSSSPELPSAGNAGALIVSVAAGSGSAAVSSRWTAYNPSPNEPTAFLTMNFLGWQEERILSEGEA